MFGLALSTVYPYAVQDGLTRGAGMAEKALETMEALDTEPAVIAAPHHMHQTWAHHPLVAGCTAACGHRFPSDGEGSRNGIPQEACAACAEAAIYDSGVVCWGLR